MVILVYTMQASHMRVMPGSYWPFMPFIDIRHALISSSRYESNISTMYQGYFSQKVQTNNSFVTTLNVCWGFYVFLHSPFLFPITSPESCLFRPISIAGLLAYANPIQQSKTMAVCNDFYHGAPRRSVVISTSVPLQMQPSLASVGDVVAYLASTSHSPSDCESRH